MQSSGSIFKYRKAHTQTSIHPFVQPFNGRHTYQHTYTHIHTHKVFDFQTLAMWTFFSVSSLSFFETSKKNSNAFPPPPSETGTRQAQKRRGEMALATHQTTRRHTTIVVKILRLWIWLSECATVLGSGKTRTRGAHKTTGIAGAAATAESDIIWNIFIRIHNSNNNN